MLIIIDLGPVLGFGLYNGTRLLAKGDLTTILAIRRDLT